MHAAAAPAGGRLAPPLDGGRFIQRHTLADEVEVAEVALRHRVTLVRRPSVPFRGFVEIHLHAVAGLVDAPKIVLRSRIPFFALGTQRLQALLGVSDDRAEADEGRKPQDPQPAQGDHAIC